MKSTILSVLGGVILLRLVALILGCFYGPYIYMVLPLGGLFLTLDCITAYSIHASESDDHLSDSERNFSIAWIVSNVLGLIGLIVSIGLFLDLGFWSMTHQPIHLAEFVFIVCLVVLVAMTMLLLIMNLNRKQRPYKGLTTY